MTIGCYIITNAINKKKYIGQSWNIEDRVKSHFAGKNEYYFGNAIEKYGVKNFSVEIVVAEVGITQKQLDLLEDNLINTNNSIRPHGYNLKGGGAHGKLSEYVKRKQSVSAKGKKKSKEHRANLSAALKGNIPWNKGVPATEDQRDVLRGYRLGKAHSEETKQKMSETHKKRTRTYKHSDETKQKIRKGLLGKKQSAEIIKKRVETRKQNPVTHKKSNDAKQKISKALSGRKLSAETKEKIRAAAKLRHMKHKKGDII